MISVSLTHSYISYISNSCPNPYLTVGCFPTIMSEKKVC